jgi:hypothetical protein
MDPYRPEIWGMTDARFPTTATGRGKARAKWTSDQVDQGRVQSWLFDSIVLVAFCALTTYTDNIGKL